MKEIKEKEIDNFQNDVNEVDEYEKISTEFFSNISHEFKTPLNVIISAIQLLELYEQNGVIKDPELKLKKYLKTMKQNSLRLLRLSNNIIDLSRIGSSFYQLDIHNHDIIYVTSEIVNSVYTYAESKKLKLVFNKGIDKLIMAFDIEKYERMILNLLSNAFKFTKPDGRVEIKLYKKGENVYISVKDNGIGISKENQNLIFERFMQVDKSFTRKNEGSGIGLSLVKALTKMHNGDISLKSEYGKGSKFIIKLPIKKTEEKDKEDNYLKYKDNIMERLSIEFSDLYLEE